MSQDIDNELETQEVAHEHIHDEPQELEQHETEASTEEEKRFTQSDVNRIVQQRLAKAKAEEEEKLAKAKARAKMDATQKLESEKADLEMQIAEYAAKVKAAGYRADLKGEVVDIDAALKLIDEEQHVDENGSVNIKAFLKSYPYMAKAKGARDAGGGAQGTSDGYQKGSGFAAALKADGIA